MKEKGYLMNLFLCLPFILEGQYYPTYYKKKGSKKVKNRGMGRFVIERVISKGWLKPACNAFTRKL